MEKFWPMYRRYLKLVLRYRVQYLWSWVVALLLLFLGNLSTFAIGWVIDSLNTKGSSYLVTMLLLITVILSIPLVVEPITFKLKTWFMSSAMRDLMGQLYSNVLRLDHQFHINKQTGKLVSIILNSSDAVSIFVWELEWFVFDNFASLVIPLILIGFISWPVSLIVLGLLAVALPAINWVLRLNMRRRKELKEADYERNSAIIDGLGNYETVRAFGNEEKEISRLNSLMEISRHRMNKYQDTFRIIDFIARVLSVVIFIVGGLWAARQFRSSEVSLGMFVVIITFLIQITGNIMGMIFAFRDVLKNLTLFEDAIDLLDARANVVEGPQAVTLSKVRGEIEFKKVTFAYENKAPVLKDLSLTIPAGQNVALVGPSGGGKTTITRLIMRYYDTLKGDVVIDGVNVNKLSFVTLREIIGLVPQEPVLFNKTLGYNIGYALPDIENPDNAENLKIIKQASQRAHIDEFIESLPDQYQTLVGERGLKLSGGQKQRVAIARVLIKNPPIVIFDEATSMLDSASEKAIQLAFRELSKDKTTIIIAHRLSTITHCDTIFYIDQGHVVEQGTHDQLLANKGPYAELWRIQSGGFTKG